MTSLQNISEGQGFELAFAGMAIVFTALLAITLFAAWLPGLLARLEKRFPSAFVLAGSCHERHEESEETPAPQLVAAIAYALGRSRRNTAPGKNK